MRAIPSIATAILAAAAALSGPTAASAEQIWLTMDQVTPYRLAAGAGEVVVGNPAIADVTVLDRERIMLFGKAPGLTNIFIFDENGEPMQDLVIRVRTIGTEMLTVQRGVDRVTYNCTSVCDQTVTVGDGVQTFGVVSQQVQQKLQQASRAGGGDTGGE